MQRYLRSCWMTCRGLLQPQCPARRGHLLPTIVRPCSMFEQFVKLNTSCSQSTVRDGCSGVQGFVLQLQIGHRSLYYGKCALTQSHAYYDMQASLVVNCLP